MYTPIPGRFAGKVAVITGGASGIGAAMATRYVAEGAKVLVADSCPIETGNAFVAELNKNTGDCGTSSGTINAAFHQCDLTDSEQATGVIAQVISIFGTVDILHNNAGALAMGTVADMPPEAWHMMYKLHVDAPFYTSRAALQHMLAKPRAEPPRTDDRGVIINTVSTAGVRGECGAAAYSSSKAALLSLTRVMAVDHAMDGIRVNAVAPGYTNTPLVALGQTVMDVLINQVPVHRSAEAEEIVSVMMFLASKEASYVTGAVWDVDGGVLARGMLNTGELRKALVEAGVMG
ncbi:uncharacterized protein B0I36DRAFT_364295 [Microdochium trichocladiopsis]|uniref:Uncharacterized protein n=1 Tax=Microdochium trichocladiopsis TaxID=1682393 RepID=A0A9P8Y681_9PEZI|nr:uncharacterized protein B0I36DRAFT_364295 [Microdochium trichocladiopsis]KAH7029820.1 hypothetical protein B0I36DRAFT_364295 [Microdochium trichocladiopsis]